LKFEENQIGPTVDEKIWIIGEKEKLKYSKSS
jgi:hypothetical protein